MKMSVSGMSESTSSNGMFGVRRRGLTDDRSCIETRHIRVLKTLFLFEFAILP